MSTARSAWRSSEKNRSFVPVDAPDAQAKKKTGTTFQLSIDVFTKDVRDAGDVAQALRSVADRLGQFSSQPWSPYALDGKIYAADGSKRQIGSWSLEPEAALGLTITAENDPVSRRHCAGCGEYLRDANVRVCPVCEHDHGGCASKRVGSSEP